MSESNRDTNEIAGEPIEMPTASKLSPSLPELLRFVLCVTKILFLMGSKNTVGLTNSMTFSFLIENSRQNFIRIKNSNLNRLL